MLKRFPPRVVSGEARRAHVSIGVVAAHVGPGYTPCHEAPKVREAQASPCSASANVRDMDHIPSALPIVHRSGQPSLIGHSLSVHDIGPKAENPVVVSATRLLEPLNLTVASIVAVGLPTSRGHALPHRIAANAVVCRIEVVLAHRDWREESHAPQWYRVRSD